jgi:hypothetical protein
VFNSKITRLCNTSEPHNYEGCLGVYLSYYADLVVPLQIVRLIDANCINPEEPPSADRAHGVQKEPEIFTDEELLATEKNWNKTLGRAPCVGYRRI